MIVSKYKFTRFGIRRKRKEYDPPEAGEYMYAKVKKNEEEDKKRINDKTWFATPNIEESISLTEKELEEWKEKYSRTSGAMWKEFELQEEGNNDH